MKNEKWRLIWTDKVADCYYNMGLDKAILNAVSLKKVPNTIRLYRWQPSAVSIGYFQSMNRVVNIPKCHELGINYIRRITGGGAVYHDFEGELTYSINCLDSNRKIPRKIEKIYEKICGAIIQGLHTLGVEAQFAPINDIILKGNKKKISGSALTHKNGVLLQHGTILRNVNVEKMFSVLVVPDEKIKDKLIFSVKERVSSLEEELGYLPSFKEIKEALIIGFISSFEVNLEHENITKEEDKEAQKIAEEFKDEKWLFKR